MSDEVVYHHAPKSDVEGETVTEVEQSDRGMFDFLGKKKEENKCDETVISSEFEEKVQVSEPEHKETLLEKIHQSHSGSDSSSSSDEECEDGEKKKKKKKPVKDTIKEKIEEYKEKKEEKKIEEDTCVPVEKYEEVAAPPEVVHPIPTPEPEPEEKKGFMEKIKEKLPGGHKKVEEEHVAPPPPSTPVVATHDDEGEPKEKKGIFEKIKEKIPGYHSKSEEEKEKEKVKECD